MRNEAGASTKFNEKSLTNLSYSHFSKVQATMGKPFKSMYDTLYHII